MRECEFLRGLSLVLLATVWKVALHQDDEVGLANKSKKDFANPTVRYSSFRWLSRLDYAAASELEFSSVMFARLLRCPDETWLVFFSPLVYYFRILGPRSQCNFFCFASILSASCRTGLRLFTTTGVGTFYCIGRLLRLFNCLLCDVCAMCLIFRFLFLLFFLFFLVGVVLHLDRRAATVTRGRRTNYRLCVSRNVASPSVSLDFLFYVVEQSHRFGGARSRLCRCLARRRCDVWTTNLSCHYTRRKSAFHRRQGIDPLV